MTFSDAETDSNPLLYTWCIMCMSNVDLHMYPVRQQCVLVPYSNFLWIRDCCAQSFHGILVLYIMYDIPKFYCFISLTTSWDWIWTFGFWCINQARQKQGLPPDLDFLWIRDIDGTFIYFFELFQNTLVLFIMYFFPNLIDVPYPIIYFQKFNFNIWLQT